MSSVFEAIEKIGIIPVIKIEDAEKAVPLVKALMAGGIPCAEITFRTKAGEEAIRRVHDAGLEVVLGAGTILTTEQVDRAVNAGASFIVCPGYNPKVVNHCIEKGIPVVPGCATPSDMEQALAAGLDTVKFFPAGQSGGIDYIKAVSAPYSTLKFIPTGGIGPDNLRDYLAFDKVIACGGSWMVKADLINADDFEGITKLCKEAIRSMLHFELAHIGINTENEDTSLKAALLFENLFGFTVKNGNASVFAGTCIELMKKPFLGKHGHIAIGVSNVDRAQAYLERQGVSFRADTAKKDDHGKTTALYLQDEIAGFAVHLVVKK
jgi:2-dehydro-3-deoxyphosphogluconate aldolase/(4S)-4-hydroxy-2-oxoglutarate aldolase